MLPNSKNRAARSRS